ncbi:MAG: PatU [Leptolyngbya sp.]|nr:MAG: PatU [Leptolyngbya sp.]
MLLQDLLPTATLVDAEAANQALGCEATGTPSLNQPNLLMPQDNPSPGSGYTDSKRSPQREPLFELGDVPAVQDRFHALLKHRLQSEIQKNPPLFPWESAVQDYEADPAYGSAKADFGSQDAASVEAKATSNIWNRQLRTLNLPVQVPGLVLGRLLKQCQQVVQSSLREGVQLVQAVEDLFPGEGQALNYLAGLVVASPARSGVATPTATAGANFPQSYEAAAPAQQMVLSLLAAREMIVTLTLAVSASQPTVARQWETEQGTLQLRATYNPDPTDLSIVVRAELPTGGRLAMNGAGFQSVAERRSPGSVGVELCDPEVGQVYMLETVLDGDETPLVFVVRIVEG